MKLSSKSILSASHSREPPHMSLSSSLNKRLVSNGSIKGGQASPMFPNGGRKRGSGFENPEPSSPKVTCIGQVRVKTKKKGKKMGARSKRRGGEASLRKTDQNYQVALNPDLSRQKSHNSQSCFQYHNHQNLQQQQEGLPHRSQRWVHLPLTICEALRAFGAEFSCFFPCRSSCTREKEVKAEARGGDGSAGGHGREGSCGAALASSLVTLQEGDDAKGKGREFELEMGEEEDRTDNRPERSHRRHVFEDIDFDIEKLKNEHFIGKEEEEEEKARVSICIPPKNALLLMRCRSDPVKMAALANRFWEPTVQKEEDDDDDDENNGDVKEQDEEEEGEEEQVQMEKDKEVNVIPEVHNTIHESEKGVAFVDTEEAKPTNPETNEVAEANEEKQKAEAERQDEDADETLLGATFPEENDEEKLKDEENDDVESSELSSSHAPCAPSEPQNNEGAAKGSTEKGTREGKPMEDDEEKGSKARENGSKLERESGTLPECLLLMMCEPKVSMEVSRETWVCTADFIRWLPPRPAGETGGGGDRQPKKRIAVDSKPPPPPPPPPPLLQPARSSCSFPVPAPVLGSNEPFVLTRCKSESRRSLAKLAPEARCWNNRKLEPHPAAHLGVGAAGVGF